ncbi:hypothetical protein RchiOBHm_Chr2g0124951 [Rosa chinensis]|uniref:Uncharacterized protein n=1 Tax=Rosa chinensis TaxID=74649 RepID=A0A2P6RTE7_ROSCH|nr:hypothetical protein RchiOBHm_Chr2g0124951 [Rosa chinensis]
MAVGKLMYCMASLSLGLKMKNKKTREWKRNMERKWRDKEMEWMKELVIESERRRCLNREEKEE